MHGECERTTQPNIAQALHLINGDFMNKKLADPKGRVAKLLTARVKLSDIIDELYLVTLSRRPSATEAQRAMHWVGQAPTMREGIQDVLWALMNSRDFLFNR